MSTALVHRDSYPVHISAITIYCDSMRAERSAVYTEKPTVSGESVVTNRLRRSSVYTFTGRVCSTTGGMDVVSALDGMTGLPSAFNTEYRGLLLSGCYIKGFTAEDAGNGYINVTVSLLVTGDVRYSSGG